jgi:hypothetical protein
MHAAQDAHDVPGVHALAQEARDQIAWIDRNVPGHRLSTSSAGRHNHPGVYAMLVRQARTIGEMLDVRKSSD